MSMICGSLKQQGTPDLAGPEPDYIARMQAALAAYPWAACAQRSLPGCGAFGLQSQALGTVQDLLPTLDGLTLCADARLDNRAELCAMLGLEPAPFSDAQLILHAYRRWGTGCAQQMLGDFAFALWDEPARRLFCARDFIGARPFYYHYNPARGRFAFAGDLLALAAHPEVPTELNLAYVSAALQSGHGQFTHTSQTYTQHIQKLPPAHCLSLDPGGLRLWAYWQPGQSAERRFADEREYIEELLPLLRAAVACRLTDPHPVGAHISGGLDSSSVAVLAHRILREQGRQVTGFSWAPPPPSDPSEWLPNDERKLVEAVRLAEGFPIHYTRLTPAHIVAYARRDITLQPTTTLQFELAASAEAARLGIRTLLSGWGGDELLAFNGRGYFSDLLCRGRWLTLWRELSLRAKMRGGGGTWKEWISAAILPALPPAVQDLFDRHAPAARRGLPNTLRPKFAAALAEISPLSLADARERPGVRRVQIALLQHGHLSFRMESWASHGATLGITYAYPLLDRRLVEFALSIPDALFLKNGYKRYLYRAAMADILPDSLRWNQKKEDPAMQKSSQAVRAAAAGLVRADLLTRSDNPYVNVAQLAAALEAEENARQAAAAETGAPKKRRPQPGGTNPARSAWLAYVDTNAKDWQVRP